MRVRLGSLPNRHYVVGHGGRRHLVTLGVAPVCEPLHHDFTLVKKVGTQVGRPSLVADDVVKLALDGVGIEIMLVQHVRDQRPKAVRGDLEAEVVQRDTQRVLGDIPGFPVASKDEGFRSIVCELPQSLQGNNSLGGEGNPMRPARLHALAGYRPQPLFEVDLAPLRRSQGSIPQSGHQHHRKGCLDDRAAAAGSERIEHRTDPILLDCGEVLNRRFLKDRRSTNFSCGVLSCPVGFLGISPRKGSDPTILTLVYVNPYSGHVAAVRDPVTLSGPDTFMAWQRPLHDGEGLGPIWRVLVFLSGFLPLLFVITGAAMWIKKRRAHLSMAAPLAEGATP